MHFLCLPLDASLNISTSHFTSTPSAFEVILQLTRYTKYLLTYLLTYSIGIFRFRDIGPIPRLSTQSDTKIRKSEIACAQNMKRNSWNKIMFAIKINGTENGVQV